MASKWFSKFLGFLFHYETVRIVDIKNRKVGVAFRLIQLFVLAYIIGYVILYKKGYQETDSAISTIETKLKGSTFVDFGDSSGLLNGIQVFDPSDYVIPPQEPNTFFVMTNMIITPNQTQGRCLENIEHKSNWCDTDADCQPAYQMAAHGNGVRTGLCVQSREDSSIKVCEIYGWCPVEIDYKPMSVRGIDSSTVPLLDAAKDFTVLIQNEVSFPLFDIQLRNIMGYKNIDSFKHCRYNKDTSPLCPIFKLGDIVEYCGDNFTAVGYRGGIYGIHINWDCDFDKNPDTCAPSYNFERLDKAGSLLSRGYNFRYSTYHVINNKRYRTLTKAFGLRFHVLVHSKGGRFSIVPLFLNFGAGIALMVVADIVADFIVTYCLKRRHEYMERKIDTIDDDSHDSDGCEEMEALLLDE